ncbi:HD-GYP domain-containing protein [Bacillus sp. 2205SS5-2]|uniref:HD-GYP domain-containing protein n=1 Tax=Bacillus sp. 2205SS5-2 TaxID=3109031 RepID=UPI00300502A1
MRLLSTRNLNKGMVLATSVYSPKGQALIRAGVSVTTRMIQRLVDLNIQYVYIEDVQSAGIYIQDPVSSELRQEAISTIEASFTGLNKSSASANALVFEKNSKVFKGIIHTVLRGIKDNPDLQIVLSDVFTYDSYIFQHSFNVTLYSLAIGMELKLSDKQLEAIGMGAILHDVGKMLVPEEILLKPGRLTEEEFIEVKRHSEYGFEILRKLHTISLTIAHCAFQHHERLDGSGYPRGIKEEDIHPFAKIIAVADVFDAVTSNRVYRNAMLPHQGLEILYSGAGTLFDTRVVEAFRNSVSIYPNGLTVVLSDGRKGIIAKQNKGLSDRPVVRIIEEEGQTISSTYEIDLKIELHLVITDCNIAMHYDKN